MRACELRISDCDSDVCSSDLGVVRSGSIQKPAGSWLIDGIGEDFVPPNCELDRVREAFEIPDRESFDAARLLLRREGILGGSSTGTLLAAALRYCRAQTAPKRRSEEHTSELQSLMRISYAVFCLTTKKNNSMNKNQV